MQVRPPAPIKKAGRQARPQDLRAGRQVQHPQEAKIVCRERTRRKKYGSQVYVGRRLFHKEESQVQLLGLLPRKEGSGRAVHRGRSQGRPLDRDRTTSRGPGEGVQDHGSRHGERRVGGREDPRGQQGPPGRQDHRVIGQEGGRRRREAYPPAPLGLRLCKPYYPGILPFGGFGHRKAHSFRKRADAERCLAGSTPAPSAMEAEPAEAPAPP